MIEVVRKGGDGHSSNYQEFIMTSSSDVANLPTSVKSSKGIAAIGSIAYTQDMESVYQLCPDNTWKAV